MAAVPVAPILQSVSLPAATKKKVIRTKDATIRTLKNGILYVDADDGGSGTFSAQKASGRDLLSGKTWFWTGSDIVVAALPAFNNQKVFQGTGSFHLFQVKDLVTPGTRTVIGVFSCPQSVITALQAHTSNYQRSAFCIYNIAANQLLSGLRLSTTPTDYGWTWVSSIGSGNIFNSAFPSAMPVADTPFIFALKTDSVSGLASFYWRDGTTPIATFPNTVPANAANGGPAFATLTATQNFVDGETFGIAKLLGGTKIYTFQDTLTNVDGHVKRGATLAASLLNAHHAVNNSGGTSGTDYAAATTAHPDVTATDDLATRLFLQSVLGGTVPNAITLSTTAAHATWQGPTMFGGGGGRFMPMSASIGSNTVSWEGNMGCFPVSDDSVSLTAMSAAQRIGIMNDLRAAYGIA